MKWVVILAALLSNAAFSFSPTPYYGEYVTAIDRSVIPSTDFRFYGYHLTDNTSLTGAPCTDLYGQAGEVTEYNECAVEWFGTTYLNWDWKTPYENNSFGAEKATNVWVRLPDVKRIEQQGRVGIMGAYAVSFGSMTLMDYLGRPSDIIRLVGGPETVKRFKYLGLHTEGRLHPYDYVYHCAIRDGGHFPTRVGKYIPRNNTCYFPYGYPHEINDASNNGHIYVLAQMIFDREGLFD